jgi:hypothetical protein
MAGGHSASGDGKRSECLESQIKLGDDEKPLDKTVIAEFAGIKTEKTEGQKRRS